MSKSSVSGDQRGHAARRSVATIWGASDPCEGVRGEEAAMSEWRINIPYQDRDQPLTEVLSLGLDSAINDHTGRYSCTETRGGG
jgi:hypothetical protein